MSKVVDERVVSMQFDNKHFESNVKTSMSTLDKLKHALRLDGATKGLNNMDGAVENVRARFSALQVMGVTALANITNSAVNAGKKIVSALTIDPIKTGFSEYETQINAVQTILANTESKGSTIDDVNRSLEELNKYADQTIYNFTEMTRNIGTFTAAGVDLDTSTNAIKGIANLAAVSGSTSQQASTAMYQLSQALSSGTVKLMDWNSVVNAGMGGQVFQDALKETARVHGVAIDDMITKNGSFRETLKDGWLTSEILTETLQKFTLTTEGLTEEQIEANREMLRAKGYTDEQIEGIFKLGNTATSAATKVKTFSQLWDVMKESAQSGWAQTWKILIGDFEEAKSLLTPLSELFTGFINKTSEWRNKILESALAKGFEDISIKIKGMLEPVNKVTDSIKDVASAAKDYGKVVDEIIGGKWGNGQARWDKLAESGYDWAHAQNLVNEKLGDATRHATKYKEAQDGVKKSQDDSAKSAEALTKEEIKVFSELVKMTDEQLKAKGYTDEQIASIRALEKELRKLADKIGLPFDEFLEKINEIDGRWLLIESFKNLGNALMDIFKALKEAWQQIFPPKTVEERAASLFNIIAALHKFTRGIADAIYVDGEFTETGEKLIRTFKGVFTLIQLITSIVGGAFKLVFKVAKGVLEYFNLDILDVTAYIGDAIVGFKKWIDETLNLSGIIDAVVPVIAKMVTAIKDFVTESEFAGKVGAFFSKAFEGIKAWFAGLKDVENVPQHIISGLANGLQNGIPVVWNAIVEVAKSLVQGIKNFLGIHSPSLVFMAIGGFIIAGLVGGLMNGKLDLLNSAGSVFSGLIDIVTGLVSSLAKWLQGVDFGKILSLGLSAGALFIGVTLVKAFKNVTDVIGGFGDFMEALTGTVTDVGKALKTNLKSKAILNFAIAVGILAAAVAVLALIGYEKVLPAVGAIVILAGVLAGLTIVINKFGGEDSKDILKFAGFVLSIGAALLLISFAIKNLQVVNTDNAITILGTFGLIVLAIAGLIKLFDNIDTKSAANIDKLGGTLLKMSIAIAIMAVVIKLLSGMEWSDIGKGAAVVLGFGGIVVGLMDATKLISGSKNVDSIGKSILSISAAMLLMVMTIRMAASMKPGDIVKGLLTIGGFGALIVGLMAATKLVSGSKNVESIGKAIFGISAAILVMMLTAKLAAKMEPGEIAKGALAISAFGGIIVGLMAATKLISGSKNVGKMAGTILAFAGAVAIMALAVGFLSLLSLKDIAKGTVAIAALGGIMAGMLWATSKAKKCKAELIVMTTAIGIMALAIAALSFIDPASLAGATIALGTVMGIFALTVLASSKASKSMGSLIVMTVAIGLIAGAIYLLAQVPWEQSLSAAGALSLVLLSLTGSLILISKFGSTATMAMIPLAVMTVVVIVLAQVIKSLATIPFESAMGAVIALSVLLTALTGALLLLGVVGMMWAPALIGIAVLAGLIVGMGALIVGIGALVTKFPQLQEFLDVGIPIMGQIGTAIGTFFGNIVAGFSESVISVIPMLGKALGDFMINIQPFIEGAKNIDGSVLAGIGMLSLAIIALTAADFIAGIASFLQGGSSFAQLGMELSAFMIAVTPFLMGASMINPSMMEGVKSLADTILILTKADLINGLTSWITGGSSLETFGAQLGGLGTNLATFAANLGTFDESKVTTITCAANAIKAMASAAETLPNEGGWLAKIVGDNSISTFGSYLPGLGTNIASFATNLGTFTEAQVATVTCAANAIKAMAEAAEGIPNEGGWLGKIVGDNSIATFGSYLPELGTNIASFATNLGTFGEDKVATVTCAANAIKAMAEASKGIENEGGWLAKIVGDNSISTFGSYLPGLGTNISEFAANLGIFDDAKVSTVTCAANAIKAMAEASKGIENEGGWLAKIVGDNSIETFGGYLPGLGTNIAGFAKNLGTFGESQIASINWAVKAIQALAKLGEVGLEKMADNIKSFGNKLPAFATKVSEFAVELSGVAQSNLNKAVKNVEIIKDMLVNLDGVSGKEGKNFKKSLGDLATSSVKKFTEAFSGANKTDVVSAVKKMIEAAIKAVEGKQKDFKKAFTDSASNAATAIKNKTYKDKFKSAGKYLGDGLVKGIEAKEDAVYNAAYKLGQKAVQGEKDGQQSNSPSKLTILAGHWLGEGLVIGMNQMGKKVYRAGSNLGETATGTLSDTISRISAAFNSDIDTQPTIRPVLDLSNVESGANAIGSMLGLTPSLDLLTNVGSISTMMNRRNQNGVNGDVVSAIHDLRDGISGMGNSYNINGVTYNEGSDVAEAIQTIIRAATVERRI